MNNPLHRSNSEELAAGPCPSCGYDLRATPRGIDGAFQCPECGKSWVEQELTPLRPAPRIPWDCVGCIGLNIGMAFLFTMVSKGNAGLVGVITALLWLCQGVWIFVRSVASDPPSAKFVTTWKMAVIVLTSGTMDAVLVSVIAALWQAAEC